MRRKKLGDRRTPFLTLIFMLPTSNPQTPNLLIPMKISHYYTTNICLFLLSLPLITLLGCGKTLDPAAAGREPVSGTIRLNGQPLEIGARIFFSPFDRGDSTAGSAGHIVKGGKYSLTGRNGVKPGKYRVGITCEQTYDRKTNSPRTAETLDVDEYHVCIVPPEFNTKSTIEFEVVTGQKNIFDYNIETSFVPDTRIPKRASRLPQ